MHHYYLVERLDKASTAYGMEISAEKTKLMTNNTSGVNTEIKVIVWIDKSISLSSKTRLMHSLVTSIFLYACESWTLTAEPQRRIQAIEMRYYRKILRISYKGRVTNEEICAKIQQAVGPHKDFLIIVTRRKLKWYGHVSRSSGLAKTILQGTVKGRSRQGRQKKRWEDNIKEWTGLQFAKPRGQQRTEKNGGNWLLSHLWYPNDQRG